MELARQIIENRVATLGVGSPSVAIRGSDEIVISGATAPEKVGRVVSLTGDLQFFDFEKDLAPPTVMNGNPTPYPTLYSLLAAVQHQASTGTPEAYYLFGPKGTEKNALLAGPDPTKQLLLAGHRGTQPSGVSILAVPANREVVSGTQEDFTASTKPVKQSPDGSYWYLFKIPPEITGKDIHESTVTAGTDPNTGAPQVTLGLDEPRSEGVRGDHEGRVRARQRRCRAARLSGEARSALRTAQRDRPRRRLQATPYIDYTDPALSLGIASNYAVIANLRSIDAARDIALIIQSGSLPYRFEVVSSTGCRR